MKKTRSSYRTWSCRSRARLLHGRRDLLPAAAAAARAAASRAELGVLLADPGRARGIDGLRGGEDHVLLVRHVPLELGAEEVEERGARPAGWPARPAQPEGLDERLVVVAGEGDEGGRAVEAAGAHGPV